MSRTPADVEVFAPEINVDARPRRSQFSWSAVWAGVVTALGAWLLLEIVLVAVDLAGLQSGAAGDTGSWVWSGAAAVVAFAIGGAVTGYMSASAHRPTSACEGLALWSVALLLVILLASLGAGIGFGATGDVFRSGTVAQGAQQQQQAQGTSTEILSGDTLDDMQAAAAWSAGFLAVTLIAAMAGATALGGRASNRNDLGYG